MGFLRRVYTNENRDFTALAGAGGVTGAKAVRFSAASGIKPTVLMGAAAVRPFGVAEYDAAAGEEVNIVKGGVVRMRAGGAVTAGGYVVADAAGDVVNGTALDANALGRAWTTGVSGDEVIIDLDDK